MFNAPALVPNPGYRVTVKAPDFSLFENRNNLPVNGRRVDSFFLLTPTVVLHLVTRHR